MRLRSRVPLLVLMSSSLGAQQAAAPPVRQLGPVEARSTELLKAVSTARALSDGRVLVNDVLGRRVVLFDKGLSTYTVVADTTAATGNAYSSPFGGLIAYKGDTSLFLDPQALAMLVIEPQGKIGRVMSVPRPNDAMFMVAGNSGIPAFDGYGRLVYRGSPINMQRMQFGARPPAGAQPGNAAPVPQLPEIPDSVPLVRVELATRKLDTVSFLKTARNRLSMTSDSTGRTTVTSVINPMPQVDDWAVLADGSIALVRGQDYHVDWVRPDGARASSARMPFEWRRMTDSMKVAYIDSARKAIEVARTQANQRVQAGGGPALAGAEAAAAGAPRVMIFNGGPPGAGGADAPRPRDQTGGMNFQMPPPKMVEPNELPDYAPAFNAGAARADLDGHLWVRTSNVINGGSVYDVVDGSGKLVDRVQLPAGRVIAGFGKDGLVYMGVREAEGVRLEQARRPALATP